MILIRFFLTSLPKSLSKRQKTHNIMNNIILSYSSIILNRCNRKDLEFYCILMRYTICRVKLDEWFNGKLKLKVVTVNQETMSISLSNVQIKLFMNLLNIRNYIYMCINIYESSLYCVKNILISNLRDFYLDCIKKYLSIDSLLSV